MKYVFFILAGFLLVLPSTSMGASPPKATPLLPESLAARSEIATSQKTLTVFLEEDDPIKLTKLLNKTNDNYAQKGWSILTIISYIHNGDVDGLFVTYQKGLVIKQ